MPSQARQVFVLKSLVHECWDLSSLSQVRLASEGAVLLDIKWVIHQKTTKQRGQMMPQYKKKKKKKVFKPNPLTYVWISFPT